MGPADFTRDFDNENDGPRSPAPVPPHERVWRHPSEISYAHLKSAPPADIGRTGRSLVAFTAVSTVALLMGLLVVVRPDGGRTRSSDVIELASSNLNIAHVSADDVMAAALQVGTGPVFITTERAINGADELVVSAHDGEVPVDIVTQLAEGLVVLTASDHRLLAEELLNGFSTPFTGQVVEVVGEASHCSFLVGERLASGEFSLSRSPSNANPSSLVDYEGAPAVDPTGLIVGLVSVINKEPVLIPIDNSTANAFVSAAQSPSPPTTKP